MTAFDQAFDIVVGHEGGYVNNPADPGGETKYGISKRSYPNVDIGGLTLDGAKAIYKRDFWDKVMGDSLDPGLALVAFDAAVNNGVGRAIRWLQTALGVSSDGVIGAQTQAAIAKADPQAVLTELHSQRIMMMTGLSTWATFGKGWSRRLAQIPYQAASMSANGNGTPTSVASTDQPPAG